MRARCEVCAVRMSRRDECCVPVVGTVVKSDGSRTVRAVEAVDDDDYKDDGSSTAQDENSDSVQLLGREGRVGVCWWLSG